MEQNHCHHAALASDTTHHPEAMPLLTFVPFPPNLPLRRLLGHFLESARVTGDREAYGTGWDPVLSLKHPITISRLPAWSLWAHNDPALPNVCSLGSLPLAPHGHLPAACTVSPFLPLHLRLSSTSGQKPGEPQESSRPSLLWRPREGTQYPGSHSS